MPIHNREQFDVQSNLLHIKESLPQNYRTIIILFIDNQ